MFVVQSEEKNGILTIKLNRPEVRNAFNGGMIAEIGNQARAAAKNKNVKAIVLRGEGKAFCAGADLGSMKAMVDFTLEENKRDAEELYNMFGSLKRFPGPVIGVAHGAAFGGALGLLAVCDYVVAEKATQFCFSEVRLGISPAVISAFILKKIPVGLVGPYMTLGLAFDAQIALRMGLVHSVVEQTQLEAELNAVLNQLRSNGAEAMVATKALVQGMPSMPEDAARAQVTDLIARLRVGEEGQEGLRAFLEKREPSWRKT